MSRDYWPERGGVAAAALRAQERAVAEAREERSARSRPMAKPAYVRVRDRRPEGQYSSTRACAMAGISYRQLDYWCRNGTLAPKLPGSGQSRSWTFEEIVVMSRLGSYSDLYHGGGLPANVNVIHSLAE